MGTAWVSRGRLSHPSRDLERRFLEDLRKIFRKLTVLRFRPPIRDQRAKGLCAGRSGQAGLARLQIEANVVEQEGRIASGGRTREFGQQLAAEASVGDAFEMSMEDHVFDKLLKLVRVREEGGRFFKIGFDFNEAGTAQTLGGDLRRGELPGRRKVLEINRRRVRLQAAHGRGQGSPQCCHGRRIAHAMSLQGEVRERDRQRAGRDL